MIGRIALSLWLVAWIILAVVPSALADAGTTGPRVLSPRYPEYGRTYGEWSASWWQWALSIPQSTNPLLDATGAQCTQGQSGSVFYLAGLTGSGQVTRECTVPAGKALFFPLLNGVDVHVPGLDTTDTPEKLRAELLGWEGLPTELHLSVDGVAVNDLDPSTTPFHVCAGGDRAVCANDFSVHLPDDNLFADFGVAKGVYRPAVDDGYYVMLAPLSTGTHTIRFGGTWSFAGSVVTQDISYTLTVR